MALAQLYYLRDTIRRRARNIRDRWRRGLVPQQRSFTLEPLEGRILLSADLTGLVTAHTLLDPSVPTNSEQATIRVINSGDAKTTQVSQVSVYASLDGAWDGGDILLGTAAAPKTINPGASKDVSVALSIPGTLAAGTYNLLARVDATNVIPENSETNNVVTGPSFGVAWQFGAVPGRAGNTTLTLNDADGTQVTFSLSGPGLGEVIKDGSNWDLKVTGTTASSAVTITTRGGGNGRVTLNDVHVFGPLVAFTAAKTDLTGTLAIDGPVSIPGLLPGTITLGSIQGGTVAVPSVEALTILGSVTNAKIYVGATLGQDGQPGGTGANVDTYGQGSIGLFTVTGSVTGTTVGVGIDPVDGIFSNGNDTLIGGSASSIGGIIIGGALNTDSRIIAGALPASALINGRLVSNLANDPRFSTDVTGPALTAGLAQDTGTYSTDGLTMTPTITGSLTDTGGIATFNAGFGATPMFNLLADRQADGSFTLSLARLEQINGGSLTDGNYVLKLQATDTKGNPVQATMVFTLDTTAPVILTFDLDPASDTAPVGDQHTTTATVNFIGQTEALAAVLLLETGQQTSADATGAFSFTGVPLAVGVNIFTVLVTDEAGNQRSVIRTITRTTTQVNQAPVLDAIGNQSVNEGNLLSFTATATDADLPANTLTFSLANGTSGLAPLGAAITAGGAFTWTPTEAQGPGTFTFDVVVSDDGTPQLSDRETITITVSEVVNDTEPPVITARLTNDTGESATDTITFDPTIIGTIADINQIAAFTAGFDTTPLVNFTDVLSALLPDGTFGLSTLRLGQIFGSSLPDGAHTLHLHATDAQGNVATIDRTFILDTLAPTSPEFDLAITSDTDSVGDQQTTAAIVTIKGLTDPTTPILLVGPGTSTLSNGTGTFQLPDLTLAVGANVFTLRTSDVAGNHSDFIRTITRLAATQQADVVLTWNQIMLEAIRLDATPPPMASRGMAMVSLAMYDTVNAIDGTPGFYVNLPAQPGTSADAAAAAAAHHVLSYLYPGQQALFDTQLATSLASIPNGTAKTDGIALGRNIANAIIAIRATDGWNDFVDYVPGNQPGDWQLTGPMFDIALLPQWADLTPFALTSPDQFTPAGPPALDSAAYAAAFNDVKALGSATGSTRTADQTQIARFWADGGGTYTPSGHWNQIAEQLALQQGNSLSANARLFAELNVALADAGITAWNSKYQYEFWRPITSIQQADLDGNALTVVDSTWTSLLITPPFPEYTSGHSTFSGAAAEILASLFGPSLAFTTTSLGLPGVERSFTSFEQAAQEAGRSRIYGGIHFEFSNQDGLTAGKSLADFVLNRFTVTTDTQGPKILLNQQSGTVTKTNLTLTGQVLDNLAGVAALQAKLDTGAFAPVTLSNTGTFSLPTNLLVDGTVDGVHQLTFQATDHQGNNSTVLFSFTLDTLLPTLTLAAPTADQVLTDGAGVSGTADATGSKLVELCYQFDNGTLVPVSFDPVSGSFNEPLDLSKLAVGAHVLSLRAQDAAGNVTTISRNVSLAAPIPLTITAVTPQPGSSDVGSTFRPQVFFSRPVNPTTLNANNFYATDTTGTKLPATIVPSQDGTFAWLFFTNPMPGASTITLHVDGTTILAAGDGQALDADSNGTPGGAFISTFSTVSLVPLAGTTLSGKVLDPGPDLKLMTFDDIRAGADGVLHTNDDVFLNPIAGAKVLIIGLENQAVFTDAQGNFSFSAVPSGNIKLAIDGRTATNAPAGFYFPEMVMDLQIEVGQANTAMGTMGTWEEKASNLTRTEVYLPRLRTDILQTVSDTETTLVGVNATAAPNLTDQQRQFLTLEVQPGSLIGPDGQPLSNAQVGISTVPPELVRDMLPPGLLQHTFDITIQAPDAAVFNTPLQMTFPNVFNAAPGTKLNFLSFDHTTGRLVIEGTATVSADGLSVTTDPGTGITKPGWHGMLPPGVTIAGTAFDKFLIKLIFGTRYRPSTGPSNGYESPYRTAVTGVRGLVALPGEETFAGHAMPGDLGDQHGDFDIQLRFLGEPLSSADASTIEAAARRWEQIVIGDLPDVFTDLGLVDDLVIDIEVVPLDGSLGILGTAAPTLLRPESFLPARGIFQLDTADLAQLSSSGALYEAALHEIGHILGIGTIWDELNLITTGPLGERGFVGFQATAAFNDLFNVTVAAVPIEVDGGPLTADGHWSESVFAHELMTGFLNSGTNPLSVISVASVADLGYQVDLSQADFYSPPAQPGESPATSGSSDPSTAMRGLLAVTPLVPLEGALPFVFRGDFGTAASPVEAGYVQVTPDMLYSLAQGFGWQFGQVTAFDQGAGASWTNLTRDYVTTDGARFAVDVPNGLYLVSVHMGEGLRSHRQMQTIAENVLVNNTTSQAGEIANPAYWVLVSDGQLNLGFVGTDDVVINAIEITQLDQTTESFVPIQVQGRFAVMAENLVTGFVTRAQITVTGDELGVPDDLFLAPNTPYRYWVLDLDNLGIGVATFRTPFSGAELLMPSINLFGDLSTDTDGDGLTDQAEFVVGTVVRNADSDGDGVSDLAEIKQGLNPLDNRGVPTGIMASTSLLGEAKEVVVEGSLLKAEQLTAYVATGSYGLAMVDISQFKSPIVLGQLDLPGDATDVSVDTSLGIAVVASNAGGLHFIDVSNSTSPTLIRTIAATPSQVEVFDGFAYVTIGSDLRSYNLLTGELVQSVSVSTGSLVGLAREGNTLYTTDSTNTIRATTFSVGSLTPRGSLTVTLDLAQSIGKVFVGNGIAYIGAEGSFIGGFATVDVSNPDVLTFLSAADATNIAGKAIAVNGSGLGVTVGKPIGGASALDVVGLNDPSNTGNFITRFTLPADPFSVAIGAGIAFVADGTGGLQIVNYQAFDIQCQVPVVSITSSLIDVDPGTPGVQVLEGGTIPIRLTTTDDVQVRNVELLVNGVVVSNDVSFPFELAAIALGSTLTPTATTVQVRATDTGGNIGLSNLLTFQLVPDTFAPTLVSSNVSAGAVLDRTLRTIRLDFSEPLDPNTVTAQNFLLLGPNGQAVTPTAIQLSNDDTIVRLTYNPLALGAHQLVIKSAAVTDRLGNPFGTQDLVTPFEIISTVLSSVNPIPPLGSRLYVAGISGQIDAPFASESFTISLDAGQIVTMGVSPDGPSLRPRIDLLDSTGLVLGSAEALDIGDGVTLQAVSVPTTGIYTLRVQSLSGTGSFNGALYLNALQESEFFGGPTNDTLAAATDLSPTSLPLQGSADRMAVIGVASGGDDFYLVDLTQGQVLYAMLQAFGGGTLNLDLRDSVGNVLAVGQGDLGPISSGILDFVAPTTGAYYLNVTGLPNPDPLSGIPFYSLVVTRNSAFEAFSNDSFATAEGLGLTGQIMGSVGTRVIPQIGLTIPDPADFFSFTANLGDVLTITTTTPGDGTGEPANTLDPALQLYDPTGALIASDLNGAADGRNAVISMTVAATGSYKIGVLSTSGGGDYTVRVIDTDTFSPILINGSVFPGAIFDQTLDTVTWEFSEPLNASTVTAQNFQLLGPNGLAVTPTAIQLGNNDAIVQLTYNPLALGAHQLVIKSAAVTDRVGNPFGTQDLVTPFQIFSAVVPPRDSLVPVGSQVYAQFVGGQVDVPFASKSFTMLLDGGQILTIGMAPQGSPTLRLRIELLDSTGALLREAEAPVAGVGLGLDAVPIPTTGVYTLRVQSLEGTGSFGGPLYLNAVEEIEIFGGPTNDTLATAVALSPTSVPLQGGADRLAVTGYANGGNDFYRVDLTQGQVLEAVLQSFFGKGTIAVDVRDSAGTVLAVSGNLNDFYIAIQGFVAPTTGTYYLNVSGEASDTNGALPQYNMVVTRDAIFEEVTFNGTLATAEDITLTGQAMGSVGARVFSQIGLTLPDPADFFSFLANAGEVVTITTTTPGDGIGDPGSTLNPELQLFDPTGVLIAFDLNDADDGRNAVISTTVTTSGQYKIGVLSTSGGGDYTVRVTRATGGATLVAVGGAQAEDGSLPVLTNAQLAPIVEEAKVRWIASGLTADQAAALAAADFTIANLDGATLGQTEGATIWLDGTAAGYGWFIDSTLQENAEFHFVKGLAEWVADGQSQAFGQMDLLTTVLHEFGHVLGLADQQVSEPGISLMDETLPAGVRRLVPTEAMAGADSRQHDAADFLGFSFRTFAGTFGTSSIGGGVEASKGTSGNPIIDWTEGETTGSYQRLASANQASWLQRFLLHTSREDAAPHDDGIELVLPKKK